MNWIGLISGAGAALIIVGVMVFVASIAQLFASALAKQSIRVDFLAPYVFILTGCLILGATP